MSYNITDLPNELWVDMNEKYAISNLGRVKMHNHTVIEKNGKKKNYNSKILSLKSSINSYPVVNINITGKNRTHKIHQLVMRYFVDNINNYRCINHINGIKTDNRVENLEWCDHSQNLIHSYNILGRKKSRPYNNKNANSIKIINTETQETYHSISELIRRGKSGLSYQMFRKMLFNEIPNQTKFVML